VDGLPDRVLVHGVTGSGKSTAALAIGARTGHPVTLVDELTWLPGWVPVDGEVQRELIGEVVAGERWLLDSAYGDWLDVVLPHAELVVGLDYPRWLSLGRLVRRTVSAAITKEPRCNGNVGPVSVDLPPSMLRTPRLTLEDPALEQGDTRGGQPRTIRATRRAGRRWTRPR